MSFIAQPPIEVTPAMVVSSTATVDPRPEWVSGTNYAANAMVKRAALRRVFSRVTTGAGTAAPETDAAVWKDEGPTNEWAMFDHLRSTQTEAAGNLIVVLKPGRRVDSIGLLGLSARTATVVVRYQGRDVYPPRTINLLNRSARSWLQHWTLPFDLRPSVALWDLPPFASAEITITLTPLGGKAKCGKLSIGQQVYVGEMQLGADSDALNFSEIEREFDGSLIPNVTLFPRRSVPNTRQTIAIEPENVDRVRKLREQCNAVPTLYCGLAKHPESDYYESFLIFGIYRQMKISAPEHTLATADIELEET